MEEPKLVLKRSANEIKKAPSAEGSEKSIQEDPKKSSTEEKKQKFTLKDVLLSSFKDMESGMYPLFVVQITRAESSSVDMNQDYSGKSTSHLHIVQKESISDFKDLVQELSDELILFDNSGEVPGPLYITAFGCCVSLKEAQSFIEQIYTNKDGGVLILQHTPRIIQVNF